MAFWRQPSAQKSVPTIRNGVTDGVSNIGVASIENDGSTSSPFNLNKRCRRERLNPYHQGVTSFSRHKSDLEDSSNNIHNDRQSDSEETLPGSSTNPYTSVSSFKCYTKTPYPTESLGSPVTGLHQDALETALGPDSDDFDDTVVSGYRLNKPPLPTRQRTTKTTPCHVNRTDSAMLVNHLTSSVSMNNNRPDPKARTQSLDISSNEPVLIVNDSDEVFNLGRRKSESFLGNSLDFNVGAYSPDSSGSGHVADLRHTIGCHSSGFEREVDSPDSGQLSPSSSGDSSRPGSSGHSRRRLPKTPNRSIFGKNTLTRNRDVSDTNEKVDAGKPKVELSLSVPVKFIKTTVDSATTAHNGVSTKDEPFQPVGDIPITKTCADTIEYDLVNTPNNTSSFTNGKSDQRSLKEKSSGSNESDADVNPNNQGVLHSQSHTLENISQQKDDINIQCNSPRTTTKNSSNNSTSMTAKNSQKIDVEQEEKLNQSPNSSRGSASETDKNSPKSAGNMKLQHDNIDPESVPHLPVNTYFSFDYRTIQELTDSIMEKQKFGDTGHFEVSFHSELSEDLGDTGHFDVSEIDISRVNDVRQSADIGLEELQILNDMDSEIDKAATNGVDYECPKDSNDYENAECIRGGEETFFGESEGNKESLIKENMNMISECNVISDIENPECLANDKNRRDLGVISNKNQIEGKSFSGKRSKDVDGTGKIGVIVSDKSLNVDNDSNIGNKENSEQRVILKAKVERTPSHKRRVMARVKTRYGKKSSMHKECSCSKNESGDILVCQFCENYELKKRSRSSLGLCRNRTESRHDSSNNDCNEMSKYTGMSSPRRALTPNGLHEMPMSNSPRPVRKVQVSSRVDVLLSTDLFRKHLHKHENLLHKHRLCQQSGMRKSLSNLDLTAGFVVDSDTDSVHSGKDGDKIPVFLTKSQKDDKQCISDADQENVGKGRRLSLTGDSDSSVDNKHYHRIVNKKKPYSTLPKSMGRSRPAIPSFTEPSRSSVSSRSYVPSFEEFKKQHAAKRALPNPSEVQHKSNATANQNHKKTDNVTFGDNFMTANSAVKVPRSPRPHNAVIESETNVPLQLQVITESGGSNENLLSVQKRNDFSPSADQTTKVSSHANEHVNKTINEQAYVDNNAMQFGLRTDNGAQEKMTRQNSAPSEKLRNRMRPRLKSRAHSNLELDSDKHAFSDSNDRSQSGVINRENRRSANKRPRSLISKKSSLVDLINEAEKKDSLSDLDSSLSQSDTSTCNKERPKLRVNHAGNKTKSETQVFRDSQNNDRYGESTSNNVLQQVTSNQDMYTNKTTKPNLQVERGKNSVSFDLDYGNRCSPFDIGESETSTSMTGSLSDSIRSELNENSEQLQDADQVCKHPDDADDTVTTKDSPVLRSTSDVCTITQEAARKRRERKERPYKSDPFSGTEIIPASKRCALREERAKLRERQKSGTSRDEIMTFLDGVHQTELLPGDSFPSLEELNEDEEQLQSSHVRKHPSNVSSLSTDSGVIGQDGSHDSQQSSPQNTLTHSHSEHGLTSTQGDTPHQVTHWKAGYKHFSASCSDLAVSVEQCSDCCPADKNQNSIPSTPYLWCKKCHELRVERKETIQEIYETEINYGRDLNILKEEFYKPMLRTGLLNKEQLDEIFRNLDELLHVNKHFLAKLKSSINSANQNNDNDLQEVMIGAMFLESSTMFLTFENFCVNQAQAPLLLEQYEREKELLRIFLQASQNDNTQLRKLHLKAFLMVPVQRIMKYPLLLERLYRTTRASHQDKEALKVAKEKIEDILGYINMRSKSTSVHQRKPSGSSKVSCSVTEKIEASRVALATLGWTRKDVCDIMTSQLYVTQPVDHTWALKRCKNYKFSTVIGVLMTLMQNSGDSRGAVDNAPYQARENNNIRVQSAAVVFIKEKNGRYQAMREPFLLEKCVISQDPDFTDVFEILEWNKEAYLVKAESAHETKLWVQNLRQQMQSLGCWRKRRNALPNILLNHRQ